MSLRIVSSLCLAVGVLGCVATAAAEDRGPLLGEVAGEPVYYLDVIEPITGRLKSLGEPEEEGFAAASDPFDFQRAVKNADRRRELIESTILDRLRGVAEDRLLLAEVREIITPEQRDKIQSFISHRTSEDREWAAHAERVEGFRMALLISQVLRPHLEAQIQITPEEIERFYRDHPEGFVWPVRRNLSVIRASEDDAAEVGWRLAEGHPFDKIAKSPLNRYRDMSVWMMTDVIGDDAFSKPEVNDALLRMGDRVGMVSPALPTSNGVWWVRIDAYQAQVVLKSLEDARPEIEQTLREREMRNLQKALSKKFSQHEDYTKLDAMAAEATRLWVDEQDLVNEH